MYRYIGRGDESISSMIDFAPRQKFKSDALKNPGIPLRTPAANSHWRREVAGSLENRKLSAKQE